MIIRGIIISDEQIDYFLNRLVKKYQGWEIEDILNALVNKDIEEFEEFVTGEHVRNSELETENIELKSKLETIESEYMTTIQEQERRLTALGYRNLIVDRDALHRLRDDEEEVDPETT